MDEDRDPALGREVQLDPAGAPVETPHGLLERLFGQVEPDERDQHAAGALRSGQCSIVCGAKRGPPVGLVHAEGERAAGAVASEERQQVVVRRGEAVDVATDVDVRVEELGGFGNQRAQRRVVRGEEPARSLEDVLHRGWRLAEHLRRLGC